jgi:hypothetical protein
MHEMELAERGLAQFRLIVVLVLLVLWFDQFEEKRQNQFGSRTEPTHLVMLPLCSEIADFYVAGRIGSTAIAPGFGRHRGTSSPTRAWRPWRCGRQVGRPGIFHERAWRAG